MSELCPSVKGPSPTDDDRAMAPPVGMAGNDDGFLTGFVTEQPSQPPRPVLPPKQRRAGGGGGGGGGNDPASSLLQQQQQPNGGAQRGGVGGGGGGTAGAPGNVAIGRACALAYNDITADRR